MMRILWNETLTCLSLKEEIGGEVALLGQYRGATAPRRRSRPCLIGRPLRKGAFRRRCAS